MSTPPLPPPTPPPYPYPPPGPSNPFDREHHPSTVDGFDQDSQRPAASACGDAEVRGASPAAAPPMRGGVDAGKGRPPAEMHHPSPGAGGPGTAPTDASTEDAGGTARGGTPTEGVLRTRYVVGDGKHIDGLTAVIDTLIGDAARIGIDLRAGGAPEGGRPCLYYRDDGRDATFSPPPDWQELLAGQAARIGWRSPYARQATVDGGA